MIEELLYRDFSSYLQYISFIVALILYNKYKQDSFYFFFVIYLLNICVFDFLAKNDFFDVKGEGNEALFNIYTFFEFTFFTLIYYHLLKQKFSLNIIKILGLLFYTFYFISFIYFDLQKYTVIIEGVVNSVFIVLFFRELLNSERILNYKKLFSFWASVGFLLFYLTSIPFFTLLYSNIFDTRMMFPILYSLIIVFHLCFIYGLIACKKTEV
jgi:hypothetical protein